ncbi:MAG: 50S ribosomal protein L32 [Desulfatitalea sp.]|jgi:large subunit ribosomal protein L32|nr:50S ribosomal protein L32 [Desulfatitalea sp.]
MALPKHKISKSRRDKRRTHQKVDVPAPSTCPECGEATMPHHACPKCGVYKGRTVTETE